MPRLAGLHQDHGGNMPAASTLSNQGTAAAAAAATQHAYQLDVCLPRLRLSSHPLMPLEFWLVRAPSAFPESGTESTLHRQCLSPDVAKVHGPREELLNQE